MAQPSQAAITTSRRKRTRAARSSSKLTRDRPLPAAVAFHDAAPDAPPLDVAHRARPASTVRQPSWTWPGDSPTWWPVRRPVERRDCRLRLLPAGELKIVDITCAKAYPRWSLRPAASAEGGRHDRSGLPISITPYLERPNSTGCGVAQPPRRQHGVTGTSKNPADCRDATVILQQSTFRHLSVG